MTPGDQAALHRHREEQMLRRVQTLLKSDAFRVPTTRGTRSPTELQVSITQSDGAEAVKRRMIELGLSDRDLQRSMPVSPSLHAELTARSMLFFSRVVGRVRLIALAPTHALLTGASPVPAGAGEVGAALSATGQATNVPETAIVVSTSGFDADALALATTEGRRSTILVEPNEAGGWTVHAPPGAQSVAGLLDPEDASAKDARIDAAIEAHHAEILAGALSSERLAAATRLPVGSVEKRMQTIAQADATLAVRRFNGKLVLFHQGGQALTSETGGSDMPIIQSLRRLFGGGDKDESAKKIAELNIKRAQLAAQRENADRDLAALYKKETDLRERFKDNSNPRDKERVAREMVRLTKEIQGREQMLRMVNQQIDIVTADVRNLELARQGKAAKLPSAEELASHSADAEAAMAEVEASAELAMSAVSSGPSMNDEERAMLEQLERELGTSNTPPVEAAPAAPAESAKAPPSAAAKVEPAATAKAESALPRAERSPAAEAPGAPQRQGPEAG